MIPLFFLPVSKHPCRLRHQSGAHRIVEIGDKALVRSTQHLLRTALRMVQRQPVAEVEHLPPAVVVPVHPADIVHPASHTLKLLLQNAFISEEQIQIPGNDAGRVAPHAGRIFHPAGRHHMRHPAVQGMLLLPHIVQILRIERVRIRQIHSRRREYLGISRPAHAFVPLRTVGGHIHEIILKPPAHIFDKTVEKRITCFHKTGLLKIAVKRKPFEVFLFQIRNALNLHIPIPIERKVRNDHLLTAVRYVDVFRLRRPQIFIVKIAALQDLACPDMDPLPCRLLYPQRK